MDSLPPTVAAHATDSELVSQPLPQTLAAAQSPSDAASSIVENVASVSGSRTSRRSELEVLRPAATAPVTLRLTKNDRSTLNKLWLKMQRGGDFPAFVRNVGEVSKRADFESSFSATQLEDSILKDFRAHGETLEGCQFYLRQQIRWQGIQRSTRHSHLGFRPCSLSCTEHQLIQKSRQRRACAARIGVSDQFNGER